MAKKFFLFHMNLNRIFLLIICLWLFAQIVLIAILWDYPLSGDCNLYNTLAVNSFVRHTLYPNNINELIVAEPLVNSLVAQLHLFGTYNTNKIVNLLMNVGILWSVYQIGIKLFNKRTAIIGCCLFCLIYSNTVIVVGNRTEIPFVFFLLFSFAIIRPQTKYVIISGICLGLAEWYRPLMPIFIPGILIYMWCERYKKHFYIVLSLSITFSLVGIGLFNKQQTGFFFLHPSTAGANLLMTANDKAYGGTALQLLDDPEVVPPMAKNVSAFQKDSIYMDLAKTWIAEHPIEYAELYVRKIGGLYIEDSWPDRSIMQSSGKLAEYILTKDYSNLIKMVSLMLIKSMVYYAVLLLFIYSLITNKKEVFIKKGTILLSLFLATLATCILVVSSTYHYPYMFSIILWAAYGIDQIIAKKRKTNNIIV